jgi:hypothetical protein
MAHFYPSHQALRLADQILDNIGEKVDGYQGRIGAYWYWRLRGGILITFMLDYTVTEQRWDILRAEAVTPNVGFFNAAELPFAAYGTMVDSPPFIHDLDGKAEWSNRLYFQMGHLIDDTVLWLENLLAAILNPQIRPPSAFPSLTPQQCSLVEYAIDELNGHFTVKKLHKAFSDEISYRALAQTAREWEQVDLLTPVPRRVTIALQTLVDRARESRITNESDQ